MKAMTRSLGFALNAKTGTGVEEEADGDRVWFMI